MYTSMFLSFICCLFLLHRTPEQYLYCPIISIFSGVVYVVISRVWLERSLYRETQRLLVQLRQGRLRTSPELASMIILNRHRDPYERLFFALQDVILNRYEGDIFKVNKLWTKTFPGYEHQILDRGWAISSVCKALAENRDEIFLRRGHYRVGTSEAILNRRSSTRNHTSAEGINLLEVEFFSR